MSATPSRRALLGAAAAALRAPLPRAARLRLLRLLVRLAVSEARICVGCWSHGMSVRELRRLYRVRMLTGGVP